MSKKGDFENPKIQNFSTKSVPDQCGFCHNTVPLCPKIITIQGTPVFEDKKKVFLDFLTFRASRNTKFVFSNLSSFISWFSCKLNYANCKLKNQVGSGIFKNLRLDSEKCYTMRTNLLNWCTGTPLIGRFLLGRIYN